MSDSSDDAMQASKDAKQKFYNTLLFVHLKAKNMEEIDQCLKNGAEINAKNKKGNTILHCAVTKEGFKDIIKFLLEKGAKINISNNDNKTPLDLAEINRHFVQILTKSINVPGDGSCLFWAVSLAYLTPVKNDGRLFKDRFERLYGSENLQHLSEVQTLIQNYNPFNKQEKSLNNKILKELINQFRVKVVKYMRSNSIDFKQSVEGEMGITFEQYLDRMSLPGEWGGEHEINAMSKMLKCVIQVYSVSITQYGSGNDHIKLYHENLTDNTSSSSNRNHYNFGVDLNIVDDYPRPTSSYLGSANQLIDSSDQQVTSPKSNSSKNNTNNNMKKSDIQLSDTSHGKRQHTSNNKDGVSPEKRQNISKEYQGSGLKNTLHGNIYQLKLLMWFVRIGVKNDYQFRLATEMDAAEKFDDLVFQCQNVQQNGQDGIVYRFLQAKHKQDESQKITDNDLFSEKDDDFSLQKYFISFRRIKSLNGKKLYFQGDLKDFILCTNINLDFVKLRQAQIEIEEITEEDVFFPSVKTEKKIAARYKLIVKEQNPLYEKLRETSDVYMLAKTLVEHIKDQKQLNLSNPILRCYHTALVQEQIIGIEEKPNKKEGTKATKEYIGKFTEKFINYDPNDPKTDPGLTESAKELRKLINKIIDKIMSLNKHTEIKPINKDTELKLSSTFGKGFKLDPNPQLTDIDILTQELRTLFNSSGGNIVNIDARTYMKNSQYSEKKAVADNIEKLAGHVLISKKEKIQFRESFFDDSIKLPGNLETFKTSLKIALQPQSLNYLCQYQFKIGGKFETCEEDQIGLKTYLPNNKIEDEEISEFLEKLVFAVNQPNEVELGDIIKREMGENNKFNLLDADLVTDSFQRIMLDWFKAKGKKKGEEGTWITEETAEDFFKSIEEKVNALVTVGLSTAYPEELKGYGIEFKSENQVLKNFLSTNNSKQVFNLIASTDTILSAIKVNQALTLWDLSQTYKQQDSYIFMKVSTVLLPKIQQLVLEAFGSSTSHHLLVIVVDCYPVTIKEDNQELYTKLFNIIINLKKKIILITKQNDPLKNQFETNLKYLSDNDNSSLNDLTTESQNKLLEKKVMFQGKEVNFNKLIVQNDENVKQHIDPETLIKLIKDEEIKIGSELNDLGKINDYYITRKFNRQVSFNTEKIKEDIKSNIIPDLFVISGTDSGLAGKHNKMYVFDKNNDELAGSKFRELCEQNILSTIHWLRSEPGKLIWNQSKGSISNLVKYRESHKVDSTEDKTSKKGLIEEKYLEYLERNKSKMVIIADTAGMGKSTVLTSLSLRIKEDNPSLWVIRINLNDYTTVFCQELKNRKSSKPSFNNHDINSVVKFLLKSKILNLTTNLEKQLFESSVIGQGKIALLFDGFDEISPDYKDVVVDILQALKKSKVEKLFVTTRPNMRKELEVKLEEFSVILEPFNYQDQINFLTKFWTKKLKVKDLNQKRRQRLTTYAESLIDKFSASINDKEQEFIGNSLQTLMLADVFQANKKGEEWEGCKEFLNGDYTQKNPKLPERFNLLSLYKMFVKKKFYKFYLEDKEGRDLTKTSAKRSADENYKCFQKRYETLALSALFSDKELNKLLSKKERQEIKKFIENIRNAKANEGIVDKIIDNKPHFIHRTFAEYFASFALVNKIQSHTKTICARVNSLVDNSSPVFISSIAEILNNKKIRIKKFNKSYTVLNFITYQKNQLFMKLLEALLEIDYQDDLGKTSLHYAVQYNCKYTIYQVINKLNSGGIILLKHGNFTTKEYENSNLVKFVNKTDNIGKSALDYAEDFELDMMLSFKLLLSGANIDKLTQEYLNKLTDYMLYNKSNSKYYTNILDVPKTKISYFEPIKEKLLIECKEKFPYLNQKDQSRLLSYFFEHGRIKVINTLLNSISNEENKTQLLNAPDDGFTPLDNVNCSDNLSDDGRLEITKYLLNNGGTETQQGETTSGSSIRYKNILQAAAKNGHINTLKYFIGQEDPSNYYLHLDWAATLQQFNIVKYFLEYHREDIKHNGALHTIVRGNASLKIIKYLIDNGEDINGKNFEGETPLFCAIVRQTKVYIIKYLVDNGADVNIADNDGFTVLDFAVLTNQLDTTEYLLLKCGAKFNKTSKLIKKFFKNPIDFDLNFTDQNGMPRLHLAIQSEELEESCFIIQQGADINKQDRKGKTPLHLASQLQQTEIVELLLQYGAIFNAQDIEKSTPLDLLSQSDNNKISWLLRVLNKLFRSQNLIQDLNEQLLSEGPDCLMNLGPYGSDVSWHWSVNPIKFILNTRNAEGKTLLHIAADTNDQDAIEILLKFNNIYLRVKTKEPILYQNYQSTSIDATDSQGNTPLHLAAQKGYNEMVSLLLEKGAIFNAENLQGQTPETLAKNNHHDSITKLLQPTKNLFIAIEENSLVKVKNWINEGAYINAKDKNGKTPLHYFAASSDKSDIVQFLLKNNANVAAIDTQNRTPLHFAAENNNLEIVKLLLKYGAGFDAKDKQDKSPFEFENNQSVDLLKAIKKIFDDLQSDNPQISVDYLEKVHKDYEIDISTIINVRDNQGYTLLHYADELNEINIFKLLLENGAVFNATDNLGLFALGINQDTKTIIESITKMFARVNYIYQENKTVSVQIITNVRNNQGSTLLHEAAVFGKLDIVQWLIEHGADVNAVDQHGNTVLHEAAKSGNLELVQYLVDKGADVKAKDIFDRTALHEAAIYGKWDLVKFLVEKIGANVNAVDEDGNTVLHIAAKFNKWNFWKIENYALFNVVIYLLMPKAYKGGGADISLKNFPRDNALKGNTALDIAKKRRFRPLVKLLQQGLLKPITDYEQVILRIYTVKNAIKKIRLLQQLDKT